MHVATVHPSGLKTKGASRSKNRQKRSEMPLMGRCCRRKQLILITSVQSEEEDCFGPSSKPSNSNPWAGETDGEQYRWKEYPAMCCPYAAHNGWGLWISSVKLQTGPSLPITLPLSPRPHKSKPHTLKESGGKKKTRLGECVCVCVIVSQAGMRRSETREETSATKEKKRESPSYKLRHLMTNKKRERRR